jgi:hypothetical protein
VFHLAWEHLVNIFNFGGGIMLDALEQTGSHPTLPSTEYTTDLIIMVGCKKPA